MKIAVFAFSRQGCATARRAAAALGAAALYAPARLEAEGFAPIAPPLADFAGAVFRQVDAMVFVGACGIAVRAIAPHVRDKRTDPAVLAVDETARFVIPLLSGHIGGANALARRLGEALGAVPAVTTATDVNGRFSVDTWAAEQGLFIDGMAQAKAVSAAILEGPVPLASDFPVDGPLPSGVVPGEAGPVGICISWRQRRPFGQTLLLAPPVVRLGIGCRRGTGPEAIGTLVDQVLEEAGIHPAAVRCAASIDLKRDEPGLLAFCRGRGWPVDFFSAEELGTAAGEFTPSDFVKSVTGVDNVCERAAMLGAERLLVKKTAGHGVTVAAALEHWEVRFG